MAGSMSFSPPRIGANGATSEVRVEREGGLVSCSRFRDPAASGVKRSKYSVEG